MGKCRCGQGGCGDGGALRGYAQGHPGTATDSQGHPGTPRDTQRHPETARDSPAARGPRSQKLELCQEVSYGVWEKGGE